MFLRCFLLLAVYFGTGIIDAQASEQDATPEPNSFLYIVFFHYQAGVTQQRRASTEDRSVSQGTPRMRIRQGDLKILDADVDGFVKAEADLQVEALSYYHACKNTGIQPNQAIISEFTVRRSKLADKYMAHIKSIVSPDSSAEIDRFITAEIGSRMATWR